MSKMQNQDKPPHLHCSNQKQVRAWASTSNRRKDGVAASPVESICQRQEKILELGQQLDRHQQELLQRIMKHDVALKQAAAQRSTGKKIGGYSVSRGVDSMPLRRRKTFGELCHGRDGLQPWTELDDWKPVFTKFENSSHRKGGSFSYGSGTRESEREVRHRPSRRPAVPKHVIHSNVPPEKSSFVHSGEEYVQPQVATPQLEGKVTQLPNSAGREAAPPRPVTRSRLQATQRRGTSPLEGAGQSTNQLYAGSLATLTGRPLTARLNCFLAQNRSSRIKKVMNAHPKCVLTHSIQMVAAANWSPTLLSPGVASASAAVRGPQRSPPSSNRSLPASSITTRLPAIIQVSPCEELCAHVPLEDKTWDAPDVNSSSRNPSPPPALSCQDWQPARSKCSERQQGSTPQCEAAQCGQQDFTPQQNSML